MNVNYSTATKRHWLATKWWMRTRPCVATVTAEGIGATAELYCPLWALPLDLIHAALFGRTALSAA